MKLKVLKVEIGTEYESVIYDFWVHFQTRTEKLILAFDSTPFDLRSFENTFVDVILVAGFIQGEKSEGQELTGCIVNELTYKGQKCNGFRTDFGTFLMDDLGTDLVVGKTYTLNFGRIDIVDFKD